MKRNSIQILWAVVLTAGVSIAQVYANPPAEASREGRPAERRGTERDERRDATATGSAAGATGVTRDAVRDTGREGADRDTRSGESDVTSIRRNRAASPAGASRVSTGGTAAVDSSRRASDTSGRLAGEAAARADEASRANDNAVSADRVSLENALDNRSPAQPRSQEARVRVGVGSRGATATDAELQNVQLASEVTTALEAVRSVDRARAAKLEGYARALTLGGDVTSADLATFINGVHEFESASNQVLLDSRGVSCVAGYSHEAKENFGKIVKAFVEAYREARGDSVAKIGAAALAMRAELKRLTGRSDEEASVALDTLSGRACKNFNRAVTCAGGVCGLPNARPAAARQRTGT